MRWRVGPRGAWAALVLAVLLLHALVLAMLRDTLAPLTPGVKRLEAVYARQVQIAATAPPTARVAAPVPPPAPVRRPPPKPTPPPQVAQAASAAAPPASAASDPMLPLDVPDVKTPVEPPASAVAAASAAASTPAPAASAASAGVAAASGGASAAAPPASPASGPAFEWPLSTRIRYRLSGWYRGDITGTAQVEWVRQGDRYQVHLDVDAGVVARKMTSDGRIGAAGLSPQRYEEVTKVVLAAPRVRQMRFDEQTVTLATGETAPRPGAPGELQDTASQFIQMIYAFSTRPELLRPGAKLALQLALPHRVRPVLYEVGAMEWVEAPGGKGWLETWPVRPRIAPEASSGRDLQVETWLAPRLQMLPVRIRIRQDAESYLDLKIEQLPEQAASPR
jgi:hypothetical protein